MAVVAAVFVPGYTRFRRLLLLFFFFTGAHHARIYGHGVVISGAERGRHKRITFINTYNNAMCTEHNDTACATGEEWPGRGDERARATLIIMMSEKMRAYITR